MIFSLWSNAFSITIWSSALKNCLRYGSWYVYLLASFQSEFDRQFGICSSLSPGGISNNSVFIYSKRSDMEGYMDYQSLIIVFLICICHARTIPLHYVKLFSQIQNMAIGRDKVTSLIFIGVGVSCMAVSLEDDFLGTSWKSSCFLGEYIPQNFIISRYINQVSYQNKCVHIKFLCRFLLMALVAHWHMASITWSISLFESHLLIMGIYHCPPYRFTAQVKESKAVRISSTSCCPCSSLNLWQTSWTHFTKPICDAWMCCLSSVIFFQYVRIQNGHCLVVSYNTECISHFH